MSPDPSVTLCAVLCCRYSVRTSSAKWDEDEITLVEKRKYRNQMGYI
jgi:hypothetical protein